MKKIDRQTQKHTTYNTLNTLKLTNVKYMLGKLIVMNVYITVKSNLCIIMIIVIILFCWGGGAPAQSGRPEN